MYHLVAYHSIYNSIFFKDIASNFRLPNADLFKATLYCSLQTLRQEAKFL